MQMLPQHIIFMHLKRKAQTLYPYQLKTGKTNTSTQLFRRRFKTLNQEKIMMVMMINKKKLLSYPKSLRANATAQKLGIPLLMTCQQMQMQSSQEIAGLSRKKGMNKRSKKL